MTDPAAFKPSIVIGTPLIAGNKQSLRLQIATDRTVRIAVPLADTDAALMTATEFSKAQISLRPLSEPDKDGKRVEETERPQGLEEQTVDRGGGYIDIQITENKVFVFNIWISDFVVQKCKGSVAIELRAEPDALNDPWPVLDRQTKEKEVPEPRITSFTASRYYVVSGDAVTLNWTIDPPGDFELRAGTGAVPLVSDKQKGQGEWVQNVAKTEKQDFILEAWAGQKPAIPDTRRLHIDTVSSTHFENYLLAAPDWPNSPSVLALYANPSRGRLYALLRDNPPKASPASYASLWYTEHGFLPSPHAWRKATRKKDGTQPLIPMEAARRPGAIFNDKLFLIGGDCCDPNSSGSSVGFCELNEDTGLDWQEVGDNHPWSWPKNMNEPEKNMNERMGHAVVGVPDEKGLEKGLWVMGGWRQDGGVCDDVWQFTGTTGKSAWSRVDGLKIPRCLFGATATPKAVWTVGGFGSPGGIPNDGAVRRCAIGANSWDDPATLPKIPDINTKDYQYCASVLFSRERDHDKPHGIATFWNVSKDPPQPTQKDFFFEKIESWEVLSFLPQRAPDDLIQRRKWYHLQCTVFRDAVFFRTLTPDKDLVSNRVFYLVFG